MRWIPAPEFKRGTVVRHEFPQQFLPFCILLTVTKSGTSILPPYREVSRPLPINDASKMAILHHDIDIGEIVVREGIGCGGWHTLSKSSAGSLGHRVFQTRLHACPERFIRCQWTVGKPRVIPIPHEQEVGVKWTAIQTLDAIRLELAELQQILRGLACYSLSLGRRRGLATLR